MAIFPSSPILVTPKMEALRSSKPPVLTGATRRKIPEDGILIFFVTFTNVTLNDVNSEEYKREYRVENLKMRPKVKIDLKDI
jgi:hypothetical protein